jgi:glycosyltransferase involved in cell wall biosynthesis
VKDERRRVMRISIVTNAFNQARFLAQAMESVLSQSWPDIEYIVVDPGSTDETPEIIRQFKERYPGRIVHIEERDRGPADGLNKAFAQATGDLFGYLNADDIYLPGCLEAAAKAADDHSEAAAIFADGFMAQADGTIIKRVISMSFSAQRFVYGGSLVLQQSSFYRAATFRQVGGFNVANRTSWDAELLLEMALKNMPLVHVEGYWAVFRIHPESITGSQHLREESRKTHARYFQRVMGRPKGRLDKLLAKLVFGYACLTQPRAAAARVVDRIIPLSRRDPRHFNLEGKRA